jgi:hypothetical protein
MLITLARACPIAISTRRVPFERSHAVSLLGLLIAIVA